MANACAHCGASVPPSTRAPRRYCTQKCRDAASWKRRVERNPEHWRGRRYPTREKPCSAGCGAFVQTNPSRPTKSAPTCRACRSANPKATRSRKTPCLDCAQPSYGERCRACRDAVVQRESDPVAALRRKRETDRRYRRDKAAPGLTKTQRYKLLHLWRKQGKACVYCLTSVVQCVDHVIPLALGGTSYEGNLAPACADCNLRKSDSLLIEWRHKKRTRRQRVEPPPRDRAYQPRVAKPKVWSTPSLTICPQCGALHAGKRYCSSECSTEWWRVELRNRYRLKVGIPLDAPHYSRAA